MRSEYEVILVLWSEADKEEYFYVQIKYSHPSFDQADLKFAWSGLSFVFRELKVLLSL